MVTRLPICLSKHISDHGILLRKIPQWLPITLVKAKILWTSTKRIEERRKVKTETRFLPVRSPPYFPVLAPRVPVASNCRHSWTLRALLSLLQRLFAWQEVFSLLSFSYNTTFYEDFPHFHRVILYAHASIVALLHCVKITCSCHPTTFMLQCLLNKQEFRVMGQSTKEMRQGNSLMYHMKQKSSLWFLSCSAFLCSWPHPALILISSSENYTSCFFSCRYICAQISN